MIFGIKQIIKMLFQQLILPVVYNACTAKPVIPGTVILADAHHDEIPFSMLAIKEELSRHPELQVTEMYWNNNESSPVKIFRNMLSFMKKYATTETVIICDKNAAKHRSYSSGMHVAHSKNSAMTRRKISLPIMLAM